MKLSLVLAAIMLSGCTSFVPVTQKFPAAPTTALEECEALAPLPATPELSGVTKIVNQNYQRYWECALKVDAWQEWYKRQKFIYEGVN